MKKYSFYLLPLFVATSLISSEPSVFGAGDLNSANPYGLTENEKHILQIKKQSEELDTNVKMLNNQINSINNQVEGVRSVFDGLSLKIQNIDEAIKLLNSNSSETLGDLALEVQELKEYFEKNREIELKNSENIKKTLKDLTTNIEKNYVTKASFNALEARIVALEGKKTPTSNTNKIDLSKKDNAEVLKIGEDLFAKNNYTEAKPYFEHLLSKNYRPARSNFVLGEIEYFAKNYSKAIPYYKKSAELYQDAEWMPKLMYHTAISFDKIDDKDSANSFYKALKATFPNSEEAKASPNR